MNVFAVPPMIVFVFSLALGFFVFFKNPRSPINRIFAILSFEIAYWQMCWFISYFFEGVTVKYLIVRIAFSVIVFIPFTYYQFAVSFLQLSREKHYVKFGYIFGGFFFVLLWGSGLFIKGVGNFWWGYYPQAGLFFSAYLVGVFFFLTRALILMLRAAKNKEVPATKRNRIKLMALAHVFYYCAAVEYAIDYGLPIYPIGVFFFMSGLLVVGYAILRYHLMDINVVIRKSLVYSLVIGLFTGLYLLLVFSLSGLIGSMVGSQFFITAIMIIAFALGFQPLKELIQSQIDKLFFRGKYDYQKTLKDLSRATVTILNLEELLKYIVDNLKKTVNPENLRIFIYNQYNNSYSDRMDPKSIFFESSPLVLYLKQDRQPVLAEELIVRSETEKELVPAISEIKKIASDLCVPLFFKNKLISILSLGKKQNREMYNSEDIDLLTTLGNHLATSIENAILHEESLVAQQKLTQADKLSSLGAMAAGVVHEIKNPLAMISSFSQLLETARKENDEEFFAQYNEIVPRQIARANKLVENLLKFGQPQKPQFALCDLNQVIEDSLLLFEYQCRKKNIDVVKDLSPLPKIQADPNQLIHVFSNLILNAMDAMLMGGTLIIKSAVRENKVLIEISDTGIGIPEANLKTIFGPFFTTKTKGTGLGLSIVYRIIEEHEAKIEVESEINKGTTFKLSFTLARFNILMQHLSF